MLSAAGTVDLEMRSGFTATAETDLTKSEKVAITNTSYQFVELGEISIPPFGWKDPWQFANSLRDFAIHIYAAQISGTPDLHLDCLVLIPSEHLFSASNFTIDGNGSVALYTDIEEGYIAAEINAVVHSNKIDASIDYHLRNLRIPIEGCEVVLAGDTTTPDPDDTFALAVKYIPRHRMFQD